MSDYTLYTQPHLEVSRHTPFIISVPDRVTALKQMFRHAQNCLALALLADARADSPRAHQQAQSTRGRETVPSRPLKSCTYLVPIPRLEFFVGPQDVLHPIQFSNDPVTLEVVADPAWLRQYSPRRALTLERMIGKGEAVPMRAFSLTPIWEYREDREQFGRLHPRAGAYHLELLDYLLIPHKRRLKAIIS